MKYAERHTLKSENHFLKSGRSRMEAFDFKGNPIESLKTFAQDYKNTLDWSGSPTLESESFSETFVYDALDRPTQQTKADGSICQYTYNEAGLLETVKVKAAHEASFSTQVSNINYNAKGQRTDIFYGNNSKTKYTYDPNSFRLTRLLTTRNNGADILQDLNYTYDALYRLLEAKGRELAGLNQPSATDCPLVTPVPDSNINALQNYTQQFTYDGIGNIEQMKSVGNWTKDYFYESGKNFLKGHTSGLTEYTYDAHGNMLSMPHLTSMLWRPLAQGFEERMSEVDLGGGGTAYYVYNTEGIRVRKIIENGSSKKERLYLGDTEFYREYASNVLQLERETIAISDSLSRDSGNRKRFLQIDTLIVNGGNPVGSPTPIYRYQYDNHLGSASLELDASANIISYEEYHPFGTSSYRSGTSASEVSLKRYRYTGKERDEETGLYQYGARYYATWLCRFISVDALKDDYPQLNVYNYAGNKPITYKDIDGNQSDADDKRTGITPPNFVQEADALNLFQQDYSGLQLYTPTTYDTLGKKFENEGLANSNHTTQIGIPNKAGFNQDYLKSQKVYLDNQDTYNKTLLQYQHLSPVAFGAPGQPHGAGMISSIDAGLQVMGVIEGGYGLIKLSSSVKSIGLINSFKSLNVTTSDGFLFKGFTIKTPFNIPVQRFGNMSIGKADFWGARIGTSKFANRTLAAMHPSFRNPLTQFTTGIIPKGTPVKFGVIGPQGLRFPGGSFQFIVPSKSVINQSYKLIPR